MKRWAWHIFGALSLLIFTAGVTLWVRSYWRADGFSYETAAAGNGPTKGLVRFRRWSIGDYCGSIYIGREEFLDASWPTFPLGSHYLRWSTRGWPAVPRSSDDRINFKFAGFFLIDSSTPTGNGGSAIKLIAVPLWLFLIFALPPLLWWRKCRKAGGRGFPVDVAGTPAGEGGSPAQRP